MSALCWILFPKSYVPLFLGLFAYAPATCETEYREGIFKRILNVQNYLDTAVIAIWKFCHCIESF